MSQPTVPELPANFQLSRLIASLWIPQAIHAAAALALPDAVADGPRAVDDLARSVNADAGALRRLLRALAAIGLFADAGGDQYALTPLGACLRTGTRDSVRSWALLMGSGLVWSRWERLVDCVRTGMPAPQLLDGRDAFADMAWHPAERAIFNEAMVEHTRHLGGLIAAAYDFAGVRRVVDVGGGHGALLPAILAANPEMQGVVFDLENCREGAMRLLEKTRLAARCEFVAGSFFESVPPGADAYLIKSVIHDWDDERSIAILRTCAAALGGDAKILIIEVVVPQRLTGTPIDAMIAGTDLNMLVMTGGRERTEREYRELAAAAGLRIARIVPTLAAMSVIELRR